ncbi:MAG: dihydrolipoamide acetyltransferase family protein [Chloroflexota bacterium]|jgi:pyruvate dehydrogenase E2 component (dihydrolipoamide acetyltransferase)
MLKKVIMPTLGLDMEGATIQKWLKAEGEEVAKDEPILVIETDKATTEITAPASGVLKQIVQREGAFVPVTETVAFLETGDAGVAPDATATEPDVRGVATATSDGRSPIRASPAARRIARELGVDLSQVKGTGPAGRIQGEDVRAFAAALSQSMSFPAQAVPPKPPAFDLPGRLVPLSRKRRLTAERMALSTATVARLTMNLDVDATEIIRWRARVLSILQEGKGLRVTYNDILVKVVAAALKEHPYLNARWTDSGIYLVEPINLGVAVAVDDGLVVPVIRDADRKSVVEISEEMSQLVARAREDKLSMADITGGSFTITNLGMFGIDSFTPIVNPPESAILGVGRIVEKGVGVGGQLELRPMMTLSLSFDHRILDGAPAAKFLQRLRQLLEEPYLLI